MSGLTLHYDLNGIRNLQARLDRLADLGAGALRPLLEEIGETIVGQTKQRFTDQVGPDGIAWDPSKRALDADGQTLVENAILKNSINYEVEADQVKVGTNVEYGTIHQKGSGEEQVQVPAHQRRITQAFGRELSFPVWVNVSAYSFTQNIPARPYLGPSTDDEAEIEQTVDNFILEVLR